MSRFITRDCKRGCGQQVVSLDAPIFSSRESYDKLAGICGDCWTEEDDETLDQEYKREIPKMIAMGEMNR